MISKAVMDKLRQDSILVDLLSVGDTGKPSVYLQGPPPGTVRFPFIISPGNVADAPFDTKTSQGRDIQRDIAAYDHADNGVAAVEAIAERIRAIFHYTSVSVEGWGTVLTEVISGPIANDGERTVGRLLTVRFVLE